MHVSGSGLDHGFDRRYADSPMRRLAIRSLVIASAAGMLFVLASWLAGRMP